MRKALAIYLGAGLIAIWCIVRAWDHLHGRPPEPDPWAVLPQPDPRTWRLVASDAPTLPRITSDNLTWVDAPPLWWSGWQTSRWN